MKRSDLNSNAFSGKFVLKEDLDDKCLLPLAISFDHMMRHTAGFFNHFELFKKSQSKFSPYIILLENECYNCLN
jgi:hypothetical protein